MGKDSSASCRRTLLGSRLGQRVVAAVFVSIIIIEAAILVPSYKNYERDLLIRLDDVERTALTSAYLLQAHGSPRNLLITGKILTRHTNLRGATIYALDGTEIGSFGELPELGLEDAATSKNISRLTADGARYEVVWRPSETSLPFLVISRLNADWINGELRAFLWRIVGLVLLISVFVCVITMVIVGKTTLAPLLALRSSLNEASSDPAHADLYVLAPRWSREIDETILALNNLLHRVSKTHREELAMFAAMVKNAHEALLVHDDGGKLIYANAACLELCGFPDIETMARTEFPLFILDGAQEPTSLKTCLFDGALRSEATLIGGGGRRIACDLSAVPLLAKSGKDKVRYLAHMVDITERKATIAALRRSEAKFRNLIEGSLQGVLIYNNSSGIIYANQGVADILQFEIHELPGKRVESFVSKEEWDRFKDFRAQKITDQFELQAIRRDNSTAWLTCIAREIEWDGEIARQLTIVDITQRKAAEEQLRQSQKMEAVGQLSSGLAHDFNNLLTIIQGNLELLDEYSSEDTGTYTFLRAALHATGRGIELTRRLLLFSRRKSLEPQEIDTGKLVRGMHELLGRTLGNKVGIEITTPKYQWPTIADPVQLESVLINLAVNARDAMPKGGTLSISTDNTVVDGQFASHADLEPGEYVTLAVSDTGAGMSPQVAQQIFEPFFTTKEQGKGTGLGLAMVYGFVRQSGGFVSVDSKLNHGTTIKIFLPRVAENTERPGVVS
ncbi:MAG: PAS domain S-box protein [Sphingomonadales bacterium]